jgi:hypothetical protein
MALARTTACNDKNHALHGEEISSFEGCHLGWICGLVGDNWFSERFLSTDIMKCWNWMLSTGSRFPIVIYILLTFHSLRPHRQQATAILHKQLEYLPLHSDSLEAL